MPEMTPAQKIAADLPTLRRIASGPFARNPLLPLVLELAQALAEVGGWAVAAQEIAGAEPAPAPAPPDDASGSEPGP